MGTGITDGEGNLASSGAGIPAFVGVLDKAVQRIIELNDAGRDPARRHLRHERSVLRRRHASERRRARDAGLRRRRARSRGRRTSRTGTTSAGWCRARSRTRRSEIFQEGLRLPAVKLDRRRASRSSSVMRDHEGEQPAARLPAGRHVGRHRRGPRRVSAGSSSSSRSTAWRRSARRCERSWTTARRSRAARSPTLPKGTFTLAEEQDSGAVYSVTVQITDEEFVVDLRDNPDQDPGPNNASRDGVDGRARR